METNLLLAKGKILIDEQLERILRENTTPKIKGNITKGKIRWRGIRLCQTSDLCMLRMWVEQRGKKIGELMPLNII
ncbi:MAG: hypothetical protein ABFD50_16870 [Smithella sp.]